MIDQGALDRASLPLDYGEWLRRFSEDMEQCTETYEDESDPEVKRHLATEFIGRISTHLHSLPPFTAGDILAPIKDMQIFVFSLESGSGHPWAKAKNFGGTNKETLAETEVRMWAILGVWSLLEGGHGKNQAYKHMAKIMTDSGRTSKGKPFSHRNIQRWWLAYEYGRDNRFEGMREVAEGYWVDMPCPHGELMYRCSSDPTNHKCTAWPEVSMIFAKQSLNIANFRDWFISR